MADIKIVIDTGADMPTELIEKYDFALIRFLSIFDDVSYVQGVDITNEEFYEKLEHSDKLPTTSQTPFGDMLDFFRELAENNKTVIYFCLSGAASGQYQSATLAASELMDENPDFDIRIVNTQLFSIYIAMGAVYAAKLAKEGKTADEVVEMSLDYMHSWKSYFLVDTLTYLEKGGRLSKTAAFVGSLLDIKPILGIEDGLVVSEGKLRGKKKLVDKLIAYVQEDEEFENCDIKQFGIVHKNEEKCEELCEKLRDEYGDDCINMVSEFGPLIGTHTGPGTFAVLAKIK